MSRGSTCFTRHWFTPVGGHGVPRPTKMAGKIEKKVFWMPYTQQGVSGGSGWILRTLPLIYGVYTAWLELWAYVGVSK